MTIHVLLMLLGMISSDSCQDFASAYNIGMHAYAENAHIGPLLGLEAHVCDGWLPIHQHIGKVAIRPLYNDAGLPLYEIFAKDNHELVGFEYRTLHIIPSHTIMDCGCKELPLWVIDGYSIAI